MKEKAILFVHRSSGEKTLIQSKSINTARAYFLEQAYDVSAPSSGEVIKLLQEGVEVIVDPGPAEKKTDQTPVAPSESLPFANEDDQVGDQSEEA